MKEAKLNLVERSLGRLAEAIYYRPRFFFYPILALLFLSVFYTYNNWNVSTSRNDLVDAKEKYHQNFLKFRTEFPSQDDLVAVVESGDMMKNRQFVERLAIKLEARPDVFTNVFYKGDPTMLGSKGMLLIPEKDLETMRDLLSDYRPLMEQFGQATNLNSLLTQVNRQFAGAGDNDAARKDAESMVEGLPALERIVLEAKDSLRRIGTPPSPGIYALFGLGAESEKEFYIASDDGRTYLVTAHAISSDLEKEAVETMRELVRETQTEIPGVNAGFTGEPVLEFDEMKQAESDTMLAAVVALAIVAIIFIYSYNGTGRPLKATICLLVGLAYTLAFTMATVGSLNILTITFAPIQIGLAIDFGVHLITRYEEELRDGASELDALRSSMTHTGVGILTSGMTTAGAFLAMGFTGFKGVREMGIISGGGLILSLIPMMILLPVLLLRGRQNQLDNKMKRAGASSRGRIERFWLSRPKWVVGIGFALVALSMSQFPKVYFDYNLLHLQTKDLPAVEYEMKLMNNSSKSLLFGAVIADSLEEAVALEQRINALSARPDLSLLSVDSASEIPESGVNQAFIARSKDNGALHFRIFDAAGKRIADRSEAERPDHSTEIEALKRKLADLWDLPQLEADAETAIVDAVDAINDYPLSTIETVNSMGKYLTEDQDRKLELVGEIKDVLKPLSFPPVDLGPVNIPELSVTVYSLNGYLGQALVAIGDDVENRVLRKALESFGRSLNEFRVAFNAVDNSGENARKLTAFQQALFLDIRGTMEAIRTQDNSQRLNVEDLPPTLRDRFVGITGKHLLQVYPKRDVWDREFQERFVRELRSIDENATGTPVQLYEYTTLLKDSFVEAAWYSLVAIALLVFIHFRSVSCVLLALLPVTLGACWTGGVMGWLGIPFNPANIMTLPLVIGIGVTSGIHILNRFAEDANPNILAKSTGKAVLVSALTTMAGFGSLMLAKHQGIESLGYVMSIGVAACMLAALTFLTALLSLLTKMGWSIKKPSSDEKLTATGLGGTEVKSLNKRV
jgi:predicted RND superfamily exporter protein